MDAEVSRTISPVRAYHAPVLLQEAVEGLITDPTGVYVDATFGGGGHSRLIVERLIPPGHLYGIDKDPDSPLEELQDERFSGMRGDFRNIESLLEERGIRSLTGLLADLGISSHQIDSPERGFSYRWEAPLDLRMNPKTGVPAWMWLSRQTPDTLARVLHEYGDLPKSRRLAEKILYRWQPEFSTHQLVMCAEMVYGKKAASSYLSPLFQAIRIAVNDEFGALKALLRAADALVKKGGRLVVLTYHSGEVRLLKGHLRLPIEEDPLTGQKRWGWRLLSKIVPSPTEVLSNPRSRSATLWIAEKI
ncbi:MAG: 16S rRNA (cytosine(1402)-N(4))-methyltransferase RsmH [Bacteroidia bacterium]|nr:16S rRNA (cytosine(1402)-N(4))-methyltransferase RsmH [Bacteroidia bacterium]